MDRKFTYTLLALLAFTTFLTAQTWQWGKSGGSFQGAPGEGEDEHAQSLTTDTHGNVYVLSPVRINGLKVDGIPKEGYSAVDYMIAGFSCSGQYRWSRVIGGGNRDIINRVQTDGQDNVYATGMIKRSPMPAYFGTEVNGVYDTIMPYSQAMNVNKQTLFIIKYDTNGVKQWIRMPQAADVALLDNNYTRSYDLYTDADGISHWLVSIPAGTFANGAYVNNAPGYTMHMLKYDANGNFIDGFPIDIYATPFDPYIKMAYNHDAGNYYLYSITSSAELAPGVNVTINGELIGDLLSYIAVFNAQGVFQSKITATVGIKEIQIDTDGSLYVTGWGSNGRELAGYTCVSAFGQHTLPFVVKLTPQAGLVWGTNGTTQSANGAEAITINGNELGIAGSVGLNLQWQGQTLTQIVNEGYDVMLARLNKSDGSLIQMTKINGNAGYWDYGTAITADPYGNYYYGGKFDGQLYVNEATTLVDAAQSTDFFVAKYGTDNCSCVPPVSGFGALVVPDDDMSYSFTYTGTDYDTISWDFGDESEAVTVANPGYSYAVPGTYTVCATVTNACGTDEYCAEVTAVLGLADNSLSQLAAWPNPVHDVLRLNNPTALQYTIYSLQGAMVGSGTVAANGQVNVSALQQGMYLMHLQDEAGNTKTLKVVRE